MTHLELLPGYKIPPPHPRAGFNAYQCPTCRGITYPPDQNAVGPCPYCKTDDQDAA